MIEFKSVTIECTVCGDGVEIEFEKVNIPVECTHCGKKYTLLDGKNMTIIDELNNIIFMVVC